VDARGGCGHPSTEKGVDFLQIRQAGDGNAQFVATVHVMPVVSAMQTSILDDDASCARSGDRSLLFPRTTPTNDPPAFAFPEIIIVINRYRNVCAANIGGAVTPLNEVILNMLLEEESAACIILCKLINKNSP